MANSEKTLFFVMQTPDEENASENTMDELFAKPKLKFTKSGHESSDLKRLIAAASGAFVTSIVGNIKKHFNSEYTPVEQFFRTTIYFSLVTPLDVIKVRLQIQCCPPSAGSRTSLFNFQYKHPRKHLSTKCPTSFIHNNSLPKFSGTLVRANLLH